MAQFNTLFKKLLKGQTEMMQLKDHKRFRANKILGFVPPASFCTRNSGMKPFPYSQPGVFSVDQRLFKSRIVYKRAQAAPQLNPHTLLCSSN